MTVKRFIGQKTEMQRNAGKDEADELSKKNAQKAASIEAHHDGRSDKACSFPK